MAQSIVLRGADIKVYLGGKLYPAKSITYTTDYGEQAIYGIDSLTPQELCVTRLSVQGNITGLKIKDSGGLQGYDIRPKIFDILHAPYISLRVSDRSTDTNIFYVPNIKVINESVQIGKGVISVSFSFIGIIPYNELDMGG